MVSPEEAKAIAHGAVGGVVLGQLDELVPVDGNYHIEVKAIVSKALDIVQEHYHLVPKLTIVDPDVVIETPGPEDSLEFQLSEIWNKVSS